MKILDAYTIEELRELARIKKFNARALAGALKVSPRTLSRCIHEVFRSTTQRWLNEERVNAAPEKLKQTGSVKITAFELGLKNQQQFSRIFKKHYHFAPTEWLALANRKLLFPRLNRSPGVNY